MVLFCANQGGFLRTFVSRRRPMQLGIIGSALTDVRCAEDALRSTLLAVSHSSFVGLLYSSYMPYLCCRHCVFMGSICLTLVFQPQVEHTVSPADGWMCRLDVETETRSRNALQVYPFAIPDPDHPKPKFRDWLALSKTCRTFHERDFTKISCWYVRINFELFTRSLAENSSLARLVGALRTGT